MSISAKTDKYFPPSNRGYLACGDFVYRHKSVPVFVSAKGPILEDIDGYRYFDAEAANGTANLGFDISILKEALNRIETLPSIPSFCETQLRLKVGERIARLMKDETGFSGRVAFELGGAQGIELALKVVKCNTQKTQFVVFEGGYHGRSGYTSQFSASHRYRSIMGDWRIPIIRLPYPDCDQCRFSKTRDVCQFECVSYVEKMAKMEFAGMGTNKGEPDVAALIIEPVLNAGGIVKPDPYYIENVVKIFREFGALIVIDETFCGFYRTGPMWGFQHYNFTPDILVMSKALTNGITPLSCVWARDPIMAPDRFQPGTHSATFVNNPLALAVADTVMDRYAAWSNRPDTIARLEASLQSVIDEIVHTSKLAISGYALGGVGRILLKENIAEQILDIALHIMHNAPIKNIHGLILASTGMAPNVVALNPPLNLNSEHLDCLRELLVQTFAKADIELS